jgi:hypothetical protein
MPKKLVLILLFLFTSTLVFSQSPFRFFLGPSYVSSSLNFINKDKKIIQQCVSEPSNFSYQYRSNEHRENSFCNSGYSSTHNWYLFFPLGGTFGNEFPDSNVFMPMLTGSIDSTEFDILGTWSKSRLIDYPKDDHFTDIVPFFFQIRQPVSYVFNPNDFWNSTIITVGINVLTFFNGKFTVYDSNENIVDGGEFNEEIYFGGIYYGITKHAEYGGFKTFLSYRAQVVETVPTTSIAGAELGAYNEVAGAGVMFEF